MIFTLFVFYNYFAIFTSVESVRFDISTSALESLVSTDHFIDKSDFVKVFFHSTPIIMVSAPRRFGKSANMDMIKAFSEITVDKNGNRMPRDHTKNYKLFKENLAIFKSKLFFPKHFGMYPVVFLSFKKLSCDSYKSFVDSFRILIRETFINHWYLLKSTSFLTHHIDDFKQYYELRKVSKVSDNHLKNSVYTLTRLLHTHFNNTNCIVLIDEYDAPIQEAIFRSSNNVNKIVSFIQKFMSITLKSNTYVSRALINSGIRLGGVLSSDANNIKHIPFLRSTVFSPFYGFTEKEVKLLLDRQKMTETFARIKDWFDGYRVEMSNIIMYNPLSITSYIKYKRIENYWIDCGAKQYMKHVFAHEKVQQKMFSIVTDTCKGVRLFSNFEVEDILKLKDIVNDNRFKFTNWYVDLFLQYLLSGGYFTIKKRLAASKAVLTIPNLEVQEFIEETLYTSSFYNKTLKINSEHIKLYLESIRRLNEDESTHRELCQSIVTLLNPERMPDTESELEHLLVSFVKYRGGFLEVKSQMRTNRNKIIDVVIIRQDLTGIIIELKYKFETAYVALQQIVKKNHYYEVFDNELKHLRVNNRIYVGLYLDGTRKCKLSYLYNSLDVRRAKKIVVK